MDLRLPFFLHTSIGLDRAQLALVGLRSAKPGLCESQGARNVRRRSERIQLRLASFAHGFGQLPDAPEREYRIAILKKRPFYKRCDVLLKLVHTRVGMPPQIRETLPLQRSKVWLQRRTRQKPGSRWDEKPDGILDGINAVKESFSFHNLQDFRIVAQCSPWCEGHKRRTQ